MLCHNLKKKKLVVELDAVKGIISIPKEIFQGHELH